MMRWRWELGTVYHRVRMGRMSRMSASQHLRQRAREVTTALPVSDVSVLGRYPASAIAVTSTEGSVLDPSQAWSRAVAAGVLEDAGASPRLYDWLRATDPGGAAATVYVVAPDAPADPGAADVLVAQGRLTPVSGAAPDALPFERYAVPDPIAEARRAVAGEAQSALHFGREYRLQRSRALYQSVPDAAAAGRRDTRRRWARITGLLGDAGVGVGGRLVLDVGCNAGMMIATALADGALWGLGWDRPEVVEVGRRVLASQGFTRFDLVGADLTAGRPIGADVPAHLAGALDGSILLYLAIRHHVGFVCDVAELPWRAMVYEGGEEETAAGLEQTLAPVLAGGGISVAAAIDYRDGEGDPRPLAVLIRAGG